MTETTLSNLWTHGSGSPVLLPGVYDGLSARIAEQAGFRGLYLSGGAVARSAGVPDLGLLSVTEVVDRIAQVVDVTTVPVVADLDTGYGNQLNVWRTVREVARLGVGAVQLEDQVNPKKCGHYAGKDLVSAEDMVEKVRAAVDARGDQRFDIIARTDAIAVEGFEAAIERGRRYVAAGADVLFVEAPETRDQVAAIAASLEGVPLLINMFEGGLTPLVGREELAQLGYRIVIVPSDLQRAAMHAMQQVAADLAEHGDSSRSRGFMASFEERDALVDKSAWDARAARHAPLSA